MDVAHRLALHQLVPQNPVGVLLMVPLSRSGVWRVVESKDKLMKVVAIQLGGIHLFQANRCENKCAEG